MTDPDVAVVGSLHLDIMVDAPRLPGLDETLMGSAWRSKCGGKGGNQAVAAARFGASTAFGGRIGADDFGQRLHRHLIDAGVDAACLEVDRVHGSGMSVAITEAQGEYGAVVVSGANLRIDAQAMVDGWARLWTCRVLLLQNEVPEAVNLAAARAVKDKGGQVVLNAAPARALHTDLAPLVDVLVVNRVEAEMLTGCHAPEEAAQALHAPGRDVILTRGGEGLTLMSRSGDLFQLEALPVRMLSSHGAGDCFCGALAARLAGRSSLFDACAFAAAAAALHVSTPEDRHRDIGSAAVLATIDRKGNMQ